MFRIISADLLDDVWDVFHPIVSALIQHFELDDRPKYICFELLGINEAPTDMKVVIKTKGQPFVPQPPMKLSSGFYPIICDYEIYHKEFDVFVSYSGINFFTAKRLAEMLVTNIQLAADMRLQEHRAKSIC